MDSATKSEIEKTVLEILENADMTEMTEYKVRKLAGEKLSMNLSEPEYKLFIREVIEAFLQPQKQKQQEGQAGEEEAAADDDEEEEEEKRPAERQKKKERSAEQRKQEPLQQTEEDDNGDFIVCRLSNRRNVTVQDWKGKKLVSIREYYEKDGKLFPSSKGISLTIDQWEAFKKGVPAIERAIEQQQ